MSGRRWVPTTSGTGEFTQFRCCGIDFLNRTLFNIHQTESHKVVDSLKATRERMNATLRKRNEKLPVVASGRVLIITADGIIVGEADPAPTGALDANLVS